MHPDNKEDNGKQDKPELSDINIHAMPNREEEEIDHFDNRIDEEEGQPCQKFVFIPFHRKDYCNECDNDLNNAINYNARF